MVIFVKSGKSDLTNRKREFYAIWEYTFKNVKLEEGMIATTNHILKNNFDT